MSARIFLAGVAVGAIVGGLAVFALQTEKASTPIAEDAATAAVRNETTSPTSENVVPSAVDTSVAAAAEPARTANVAPPSSDTSLPGAGSTADVAPASSPDPGEQVFRAYADEQSRGESMEQIVKKMKAEARDDAWATNMENELRDYLARRPAPNALGSTTVECRTTLCRVLSVVNDDVVAAMPRTDLQAAISGLPDESLGREVVVIGIALLADSKHPRQSIEAAFLRRADKAGNSSQR